MNVIKILEDNGCIDTKKVRFYLRRLRSSRFLYAKMQSMWCTEQDLSFALGGKDTCFFVIRFYLCYDINLTAVCFLLF